MHKWQLWSNNTPGNTTISPYPALLLLQMIVIDLKHLDEENVQRQVVIIPLGILLEGIDEQWEKRWLPILVTLPGTLADARNNQISNIKLIPLVRLTRPIRYMS